MTLKALMMAVAVISMGSPAWAEPSICLAGKRILQDAAIDVRNAAQAQKLNLSATLQEEMNRATPENRRKLQGYAGIAMSNMYHSRTRPENVFPETSDHAIEAVLSQCKTGEILIIPDPGDNRFAVAKLCNLEKPIISTISSIICIIN